MKMYVGWAFKPTKIKKDHFGGLESPPYKGK